MTMKKASIVAAAVACCVCGCGGKSGGFEADAGIGDGETGPGKQPSPSCQFEGGGSAVDAPLLLATLHDRWHEAWLASPAAADLDGDGVTEIVVPRHNLVLVWHLDGQLVHRLEVPDGRIWASPVVADLSSKRDGLEIAVASRDKVYAWDSGGRLLDGFPAQWQDEMRSLAAGDVDGDGELELVAVSTGRLESGGQRDIVMAFEADGSRVAGYPPNTSGTSGCDDRCYVTGGYDQNIALGDLDGDGADDILATQDNAYVSVHRGDGTAFDAADVFESCSKIQGVRFLHDFEQARQGWADDERSALQAHFTNSAPAIADIDGDGIFELVVLGSVQNAAQTDRKKGVGLWVFHPDGTRLPGWMTPYHAPDYLSGLWDFDGTNVVAATNGVSVADLYPDHLGLEMVFAGFDGRIHCVDAGAKRVWSVPYTDDPRVLTAGVAIADLSRDGRPELVFTTYSPDEGKSFLFIWDASGRELHKVPLPKRGAMPVPTLADVDGDGTLEIIISLKDGEDKSRQVLVYTVSSSSTGCLLWPTGRGNAHRSGFVPSS